jgi:uncharacterized protein
MGRTFLITSAALLGGALLLYAAVLAWLWFRQERLLFFPEVLPAQHALATEPQVRESVVAVPGAQLSVLHLELPAPQGVVFFLHGNAGNLATWFTNTQLYRRANYDLVMMDYRGYGKSTGRITSEAQLHADVQAVWAAVAPRYQGRKLVVYGRSLGSGLAARLTADLAAAGRAPDLTVLVSPYSSVRELTAEFYPWVPSAVLRYPLDTTRHAGSHGPRLLLIHGDKDELIGLHHARRLRAALPGARLEVIQGAAHNDVHLFPAYEALVLRELAQL